MVDFFMVDVSVTGGLVKIFLNVVAVVLILSLAPSAHAGFVVNTLGAAGPSNYALLALGASPSGFSPGSTTGTTDLSINGPCGAGSGINCINGSTANVTGNVGMADPNGKLSPNASSGFNAIDGNLFLAASQASNPINGSLNQINGNGSGIFYSQDLSAANTAAFNASTTFAALAASSGTPTSVTGTTTINAVSGSNTTTVVNLSSFNLGNGKILTLNGSAGDQFVINVSASDFSTLQ